MMSEFKRLHPLEILISFIGDIKSLFFSFILLYVWLGSKSLFWYLIIILSYLVIHLLIRLLGWWRYVYRVTDTELQIEYGLFIRKKSFISKYRIQSIDITEGILHRIFGLAEIKIETASKTSSNLKAVKKSAAIMIQNQLKISEQENEEQMSSIAEEPDINKQVVTNQRLFFAGMTSSGVGVLFVGAWVIFSQLEEFIPDYVYESVTSWLGSLGFYFVIILTLTALLIAWLVGILMSMIKNGRFTISKVDNDLIITKGLIEKKRVTIPLNRIQAIGFKQNLLREPFGYGTLYAEVAGGELIPNGGDTLTDLFPIIKKSEINDFLSIFASEHGDWQEDFNQPPKVAYKGYLFRSSGILAIITIGGFFIEPILGWIALGIFLVSILFGHLNYKNSGFYLDKDRLFIKQRRVSKIMTVIFHKRIQAYDFKQHYFQKRSHLATIRTSIISGNGATSYKLKSMAVKETEELTDWYRPVKSIKTHDLSYEE